MFLKHIWWRLCIWSSRVQVEPNSNPSCVRSQLFSQGDFRLEFQEVIRFCFAPCFWLFSCIFDYQQHEQPDVESFIYILSSHQRVNWPVELAWTKKRVRQLLIFSLSCSLKVKFIKKDVLETHKKFNFVTSRGQFTGKTWYKIFLKQFLADFVTVLSW